MVKNTSLQWSVSKMQVIIENSFLFLSPKQKNMTSRFFTKKSFLAAMAVIVFAAFGCHNNDTTADTDQSHTYDTTLFKKGATETPVATDTTAHAAHAMSDSAKR
ncbi:MAG: hypothetical protein JSU03_10955 [Bacteroidetes bacterium]|nr:hypothetical protein [Bacteroidota bacterium]